MEWDDEAGLSVHLAALHDPESDTAPCGKKCGNFSRYVPRSEKSFYFVDVSFSFPIAFAMCADSLFGQDVLSLFVCSVFEFRPQDREQKLPRCKQLSLT